MPSKEKKPVESSSESEKSEEEVNDDFDDKSSEEEVKDKKKKSKSSKMKTSDDEKSDESEEEKPKKKKKKDEGKKKKKEEESEEEKPKKKKKKDESVPKAPGKLAVSGDKVIVTAKGVAPSEASAALLQKMQLLIDSVVTLVELIKEDRKKPESAVVPPATPSKSAPAPAADPFASSDELKPLV